MIVKVPRLDRGHARALAIGAVRAHFGVTDTGVEIFTRSPRGVHKPPYH